MSSLGAELKTYQDDFTKNLDTQFTNIGELQEIQKKLFTDLEKLAGSPNIADPGIQQQINDKFSQIDNLTKLRTNIFETIKANYGITQSDYNIQNGFNAVNSAAETMATSGGKRFKKTRHFKLTNKNKNKTKKNV